MAQSSYAPLKLTITSQNNDLNNIIDTVENVYTENHTNLNNETPNNSTVDLSSKIRNMAATSWDKFQLLMWKNWLLQWRHKIQMIVEILVPVVFSALLVLIRSLVEPEVVPEATHFEGLQINTIQPLRDRETVKSDFDMLFKRDNRHNLSRVPVQVWDIAYSPGNVVFDQLIGEAANFLAVGWQKTENPAMLENLLVTNHLIAGIEFHHPSNITELPQNLAYSLRFPSELRTGANNPLVNNWRTDHLFPLFATGGPRNRNRTDGGLPPGYFVEGFLAIQNAIARSFLTILNTDPSTNILPNMVLQRYPFPPYIRDILLQGLESFVSLIILMSFVYPCINTVKFIATEKEKQLKESMKIMGLPNWLHWSGWFLRTIIYMTISITLMVVLLKVSWYPGTTVSVFTHTHFTTLWAFLFIYSISVVTYCFMLSVFFSKANTAAAVAGLVWFIFYAPYTFTQQNFDLLTLAQKLLVSLFSNTAMGFGFQMILRWEGIGDGLQWNNLFVPVSVDDDFHVGHTWIMLIVDSILYLAITLYVEKVFPGDFGVPEPWYFLFTKKFWCGKSYDVDDVNVTDHNALRDENEKDSSLLNNIEADPKDRHAGIQVRGLRKIYANKKVAVKGFTMNMFDDQITVLLGHNGAGKTTTMSMLTGMFPPTSGTAIVNGKDIRYDIQGVRNSLGLCPQHNILFDELTVREHIVFYSRLKGLRDKDIDAEIQKYVKILELEDKLNALSSTLSGGMKRKLSVGVALCGRSKVVLCDEPSSGMDPAARRALWDLLQKEKKGRTILLSTHFMDEADILGDRIAIMANGEIKCIGTSFFLKKRFGIGYHLICVKGNACQSHAVTELLRKYVPDVKIESDIGTELSFQLSDEYSMKFESMLKDLETNSEQLGLTSYGVSLTTLEEVFMKVGTDPSPELINSENTLNNGTPNVITPIDSNGEQQHSNGGVGNTANGNNVYSSDLKLFSYEDTPLLKGGRLILNHWFAMYKKKALYTYRNWLLLLIQNLIPICFIILTVLVVRIWAGFNNLPALPITLESYVNTVTLLQHNPNFIPGGLADRISIEYEQLFDDMSASMLFERVQDISVDEHILEISKTMLSRVNSQYLAAATIIPDTDESLPLTLVAWFNNQPHHAAPISLNLLHNALVRAFIGSDYSIDVTNAPYIFTPNSRMEMLQAGNNMGFQLAANTAFAMAFVSAFYVLFYIKERESRAKLLQFVSGVNVFTFWMSALIWDYLTYLISAVSIIVVLAIFQEEGWSTTDELGRTFLILVVFGVAMLPITYIASMFFSVPATGFTRMAMFYIFTGMALYFIVFIMRVEDFELQDVANGLTWFFLLFPHFALSLSLSNLNTVTTVNRICNDLCDPAIGCNLKLLCETVLPIPLPPPFDFVQNMCCNNKYFSWEEPGMTRNLIYMSLVALSMFIILLIKEYKLLEAILYKGRQLYKGPVPPESEDGFIDSDVMAEKERIKGMSMDTMNHNNLVMKQMSKFYKKFLAVNQLSVGISHSECFGLLGVNGAGKTSTFKMLTGDEKISSGEAWLSGYSLKDNMHEVHQNIGYCPQFDALIEDLTGRETLSMFCLLRGVKNHRIFSTIVHLAHDLNFTKHLDKKIKEYSGGNKRKLSTAIALIGNPVVIYLDEPTTGMDPGAKRQLWNMVCKVRKTGKSIVLTSHSMEECEALCTRLAIMVNGEFKCLGSVQHLKSKFSKGFVLTIKVKKEDFSPNSAGGQQTRISINNHNNSSSNGIDLTTDAGNNDRNQAIGEILPTAMVNSLQQIKEFVGSNFNGAYIKEEYQGLLTYSVPDTAELKWSTMFGLMENAKDRLNIEDYSLSQTSLEQVFLSFTKYQREEKKDK